MLPVFHQIHKEEVSGFVNIASDCHKEHIQPPRTTFLQARVLMNLKQIMMNMKETEAKEHLKIYQSKILANKEKFYQSKILSILYIDN